MRILAISHLFPHVAEPRHGVFAARQFAAFQKLGAEVVVIFPTIKIPKILRFFKEKWQDYDTKHRPLMDYGLEVIQVPCVRFTRGFGSCCWDGLILYHTIKKKVLQLHRDKPFDIIYGRGLFPGADTAAHFSKLLNIPSVGVAIGGDVNEAPRSSPRMYHHFVKVLRRLDGVLANGQGLAHIIQNITGKECPTAHGVVDVELFCPVYDKAKLREKLGIPLQSQVLLYAGYLKKEKGLYELIQAFAQIHKQFPDTILKICGRGVEYKNIKIQVDQKGLSDSIHLVGTVAPSEMHKWMQASDMFVLPSYMEGMPNVVMEAMACGLPVVSTSVGGLPDSVGDSAGAVLIEPRTVKPLVEALWKVCTDKSLRDRMSIAARQTAEKKFSLKVNVKKILEYLESVIEQYKKHS